MTSREGYIKVSGIVRQEGKHYVAWCPELDIASSGESVEEAYKNLADAVDLYLQTLDETGEKQQVLTERGIPVSSLPELAPTVFISSWDATIKVG